MKRSKRILVIAFTVMLTLGSTAGAAFADIDYSQWDSQAAYPQDIINTPLLPAVKALLDKKIITGYPDGTFKPENNITRAEVAVMLTKMTNRTNELAAAESRNKFSDLSGYGWAKGYINVMADVGIVKGITSSTFEPAKNINYAELITMLIRTKGGVSTELESQGNWPNNYIQYAQMYNMLGDVAVSNWMAPVNRGDVAKLFYRNMPKTATTAGDVSLSSTTISKASIGASGTAYLSVSTVADNVTTTFQWYRNGAQLPGETSYVLNIPFSNLTKNDRYYVVVKTKKTGYTETTVTSETCIIVD